MSPSRAAPMSWRIRRRHASFWMTSGGGSGLDARGRAFPFLQGGEFRERPVRPGAFDADVPHPGHDLVAVVAFSNGGSAALDACNRLRFAVEQREDPDVDPHDRFVDELLHLIRADAGERSPHVWLICWPGGQIGGNRALLRRRPSRFRWWR